MTYEPLHHKYRPQTFADLVGQDAIATTLSNAVRTERIAPAYLFTGPRGTGKTSSARILAKSLNCLHSNSPTEQPCGVCEVCRAIANSTALDVIEIDAASNTGVDNIRELIERAQFAPVQCRYKIYCIDECHMLSTAAFNALLKTLEEPPDRVVFVLATTDLQRVLPTIISRCQRFDFRRIALEPMVAHLRAIAIQENIKITEEALQLVAQIAQGGLRDAESLLDQLSLLPEQITPERVWDLVGAVPERNLLDLLGAITTCRPEAILEQARHLLDRGREPLIVLQNLAGFYRDLLIAKTAPERSDLVGITPPIWVKLCDLAQAVDFSTILAGQQHLQSGEVQLRNTTQPQLWLEVLLLGLLPSTLSDRSADEELRPLPVSAPQPESHTQSSALHPFPPEVKQPAHPATLATDTANGISQPERQPVSAKSLTSQLTSAEAGMPGPVSRQPLPAPSVGEIYPSDLKPPTETSAALAQDRGNSSTPLAVQHPDLDQLWQEVIDHLQPFSTQALLRQLCRLIAFDGRQARVSISSQSWFKTSQEKLPNIEAAFQAVFGRQVKVKVEVAASSESRSTPISAQRTPLPPSLGDAITATAIRPVARDSAATLPNHLPSSSPQSQTQTDVPEIASIEVTQPTAPHSTQPLSEAFPQGSDLQAPPPVRQEDEDVIRAAKSVAQFFNGEIVSQEGLEGVNQSTLPGTQSDRSTDLAQPQLDTSEPDFDSSESDEVPF